MEQVVSFCECGCGQIPPIAIYTIPSRGYIKGRARPFVPYHHLRVKNGRSRPAIDRFLEKVRKSDNGCHEWIGAKSDKGYGHLFVKGHLVKAHRFIYQVVHGSIESTLTIDHLCRNRLCVNPKHLEAVTMQVNVLRGNGAGARYARRTHCSHGHELIGDNIISRKDGGRRCRICKEANAKQ